MLNVWRFNPLLGMGLYNYLQINLHYLLIPFV